MWLNVLAVKNYYDFLVYMIDGSVMVTFISKQRLYVRFLEMNCKVKTPRECLRPYFVHK